MEINFEKAVKSGVEQAMRECELTIGMTLKEAVEKQVPEKVTNGTCPNCYRIFLFRHGETRKGNYCDNCGKALIWED